MSSLDGVNAVTIIFAALCVFAIGYRFYGLFIAAKVLNVDANRVTPAVKYADGQDYVKTDKFVLFGHHFAAIAAAGPLLGPVLAAQFGYLPGLLWILIGCVLAGGVHDMVVLFCSVRHKGRSLAYIATREIDPTTGFVASWAVLAILILTLAGLSIACVNAMHDSLWSTYTVVATIPIAIIMGLYLQIWRKGDVLGATLLGVVLLFLCILSGPWVASHPEYFDVGLDPDLRLLCICSSGVAAALAARLPVDVPQGWYDPCSGSWHRLRDARVQDACHYRIHPWRRPDRGWSGDPVHLHYDCLRCLVGFPCHDWYGYDPEDDRK